MKTSQRLMVVAAATIGVLAACQHHPDVIDDNGNGNGNNNPPDTIVYVNPDPCSPDTVYFQNTILPMINSSCSMNGCHDSNGSGDASPYTTYGQIRGDRNSMLSEMLQGSMPPWNSGITMTDEQIAQFQLWIQQGARNNSCIEDCDSTQGSYATNVLPIIETYCVGCHGSNSPSRHGGFSEFSLSQLGSNIRCSHTEHQT